MTKKVAVSWVPWCQLWRSTSNRSASSTLCQWYTWKVNKVQTDSVSNVSNKKKQCICVSLNPWLLFILLWDKSYLIAVNDPLPSAISVWDTAHCQHRCTNFIPQQLCLSSRFLWTLTLDNSPSLSQRGQITSWQAVKLTPAHGFSLQTCVCVCVCFHNTF